jgi:hypothetical protein
MEVFAGVFAVLYMILVLLLAFSMEAALMAFTVVVYVLEGKSLSAIARRRGIDKPWLAWVPVGSSWLLGAISDQYRYVAHGQIRNRRKLLAWLSAALYGVLTVLFVVLGVWIVGVVSAATISGEEAFMAAYLGGFVVLYLAMLLLIGVSTVMSVFQYMAYYDLFRSCDPGKSLIYLLVSIFTTYPLPFFVYSCRDKDLGMPPKKDDIVE